MPPEYFYPLLGVIFVVSLNVLRTIRVALGEKGRSRRVEGSGKDDAHIHELEGRVAELEERVDFAERLLTRGQASGTES